MERKKRRLTEVAEQLKAMRPREFVFVFLIRVKGVTGILDIDFLPPAFFTLERRCLRLTRSFSLSRSTCAELVEQSEEVEVTVEELVSQQEEVVA